MILFCIFVWAAVEWHWVVALALLVHWVFDFAIFHGGETEV